MHFEFAEDCHLCFVRNFLPEQMVNDLCVLPSTARTVKSELDDGKNKYQGKLNDQIRRSRNVFLPQSFQSNVYNALMNTKSRLTELFHVNPSDLEAPQFLIYSPGDFFKIHRDRSRKIESKPRLISLVLFLNSGGHSDSTDSYQGGELYVYPEKHGESETLRIRGVRNTLLAFRSDVLHEVKTVSEGERLTIVSWFH